MSIDPLKHNPLALPILMDWKRDVVKRRGKTNKRDVYYRTPCNRRLRNMAEVIRYLQLTGESSLNVDHFTFDWRVRTDNIIPPVGKFVFFKQNGLVSRHFCFRLTILGWYFDKVCRFRI